MGRICACLWVEVQIQFVIPLLLLSSLSSLPILPLLFRIFPSVKLWQKRSCFSPAIGLNGDEGHVPLYCQKWPRFGGFLCILIISALNVLFNVQVTFNLSFKKTTTTTFECCWINAKAYNWGSYLRLLYPLLLLLALGSRYISPQPFQMNQ